ncbi:MAG: hypothetical protein HOC20_13385, partial [Chloroflexi bacterium]|nr:hypothetical protein [Chloroflexota bacterium]
MAKIEIWQENRSAVLGMVSLIIVCVISMGYIGVSAGQGYAGDPEP